MKRRLVAIVAGALLLFSGMSGAARATPNGVFWLTCLYSHSNNDDVIKFPGMVGVSHRHDNFGNHTVSANSTYESMLGQATGCKLHNDTAGYWFPAIVKANGTFVQPKSINVYYWGEGGITQSFPADFREIAGATVGTPTSPSGHLYYTCQGTSQIKSATLPNCGPDKVRAQVEFPSCWDGVETHDNDTSHMAYPNGDVCLADHPIYLPRLVEHITWNVTDASNMSLASDAAMGVSHGESLHADFWNTWDQAKLDTLIATCVRNGASCKDLSG